MILTIGNSSVYEFEAFRSVQKILQSRGREALLFKQDKCLDGEIFSYRVKGGKASHVVSIDGKEYSLDEFSAVWYLKPHLPKSLICHSTIEHRQFIHRQFYVMREAVWSLLRHKRWINDPWAMMEAENKMLQMSVAAEIGFTLPDTVVTSSPDEVRKFYADHDDGTVVKTLAVSPLQDRVIYTNLLSDKDMEKIESVRMSPSIFQAMVPKKYELRITVVGDKIFPVKILSQDDPETSIDWRKKPVLNDHRVKMEPTELSDTVVEQLHGFLARLGLRFGCVDMIVTPDDECVFLEINPNGQWYFVQLNTGQQIAEAIADLLVA